MTPEEIDALKKELASARGRITEIEALLSEFGGEEPAAPAEAPMDEDPAPAPAEGEPMETLPAEEPPMDGTGQDPKRRAESVDVAAKVDAAVRARLALIDRARALGGADLAVEGTERQVLTRALAKIGVRISQTDSDAYVVGRFDAELDLRKRGGRVVDALRDAVAADNGRLADEDDDWLAPVWDAMDRRLSGGQED